MAITMNYFNRLTRYAIVLVLGGLLSGCTLRHVSPLEMQQTRQQLNDDKVLTMPAPEERGEDYVNRRQHKTVALNPITLTASSTPDEIDNWARYENVPKWVRKVFFGNHFDYRYTIDFSSVRPLYLVGDFNNDGKQDIALIIQDMFRVARMHRQHPGTQEPPEPIMAIFHYGSNEVFLVTKDLPQVQLWQVLSKYENMAGSGDGILLGEPRGEQKYIYWNGTAYQSEWVERSDQSSTNSDNTAKNQKTDSQSK